MYTMNNQSKLQNDLRINFNKYISFAITNTCDETPTMNHYQSDDLHKARGLSFHVFNQDGLWTSTSTLSTNNT